jgi:porin
MRICVVNGQVNKILSNRIAPFVAGLVGGLKNGQGGEVFYNDAINRRLSLTGDAQLLQSALDNVDTAWIVGNRANLAF